LPRATNSVVDLLDQSIRFNCFDVEHSHTISYLSPASPRTFLIRAELAGRPHGRPWPPPFSAAAPVGKPQNRIPSPSSLSITVSSDLKTVEYSSNPAKLRRGDTCVPAAGS
jgi:hypothetical protein